MLTTQRRDRRVRRQTRLVLESLHDRLVLSAGALSAAAEAVVHHPAADHSLLQQNDHHTRRREVIGHGSPATLPLNVAAGLRLLFREYKEQGGGSRFAPSPTTDRPLQIIGTRVAVLIKVAFPPALDSYVPRLRALGLDVIRTIPDYGLVEGTLRIAKLPAAAQLAAKVWPAPASSLR